MKRNFLFAIILLLFCATANTQNLPKRELRGAWVATFSNIDWPASGSTTSQEQSTYIQRMTELQTAGMNAVFVQIRSQCDAMYQSSLEPWSKDLTGTQGSAPNPYYDPLSFMITETRKKGMEFHAWINPYRALSTATTTSLNALHSSHIINTQPSWILDCTSISSGSVQKILNPGLPQVTDYIISVVMDIVRRYDIDGIHFDDYFYPNPALSSYNDDATFAANSRGISTKAEWRRANVDTLIRRLNDSIHTVKPWVKFGISPTGIWLSYANSPSINTFGSNTSSGATQHYKDLFCNSRLWQQQGWVDYLMPQVYWYMGQTGSDYNNLIPWWNNNAFNRHIYIGLAGYKVGDASQGNFGTNNREIPNQIRLNRQSNKIGGQVIYNLTSLRNNPLGYRDSLSQFLYNKPALLPTMSWIDNTPPNAPSNLAISQTGLGFVDLSWTNPSPASNEMDKVKRIAIYRSTNPIIDISNTNNLLAITWNDAATYTDNTVQQGTVYYYTVTALDRHYNESAVSNTVSLTTLPLQLVNFSGKKNSNFNVELNWQTKNELNLCCFEVQRAEENFGFTTIKKVAAKNADNNSYLVSDDVSSMSKKLIYRIKMIEKDGNYTYSKSILISADKTLSINIYPTILRKGESIVVSYNSVDKNQLSFVLADATGKIVQQTTSQITGSGIIMKLNNNLSSGMYYLIVNNNKGFEKKYPIVIY